MHLLVAGEPLGVDEPEIAAAAPCLAVRGLLLPALSPPLSLRLSSPLLGSELGVLRPAVPELLRRKSMSPAGDKPGEAALAYTGHQSSYQPINARAEVNCQQYTSCSHFCCRAGS